MEHEEREELLKLTTLA